MRLIDANALLIELEFADYSAIDIKNLITNAPTIQREGWVSVEDRLPEEGDAVLYHAPIFDPPSKNVWAGEYFGNGTFGGRAGFFGGGEVTHWQPLPAAPTETE